MKNVRDAAVTALAIIVIKLLFRLIPPADRFASLFEYGIWIGLGIILTAYIAIFLIVYLILVISRRRKRKKAER